jgi:hypothetical protein
MPSCLSTRTIDSPSLRFAYNCDSFTFAHLVQLSLRAQRPVRQSGDGVKPPMANGNNGSAPALGDASGPQAVRGATRRYIAIVAVLATVDQSNDDNYMLAAL